MRICMSFATCHTWVVIVAPLWPRMTEQHDKQEITLCARTGFQSLHLKRDHRAVTVNTVRRGYVRHSSSTRGLAAQHYRGHQLTVVEFPGIYCKYFTRDGAQNRSWNHCLWHGHEMRTSNVDHVEQSRLFTLSVAKARRLLCAAVGRDIANVLMINNKKNVQVRTLKSSHVQDYEEVIKDALWNISVGYPATISLRWNTYTKKYIYIWEISDTSMWTFLTEKYCVQIEGINCTNWQHSPDTNAAHNCARMWFVW